MAPSPLESRWRRPSSPRAVASTVVASLQYVTSSVRLLLIGCFQCGSFEVGCWGHRQEEEEEQDGAWFDCEKLQVEHPYCYVNPVALADGDSTTGLPASPHQPRGEAKGLLPGLSVPASRRRSLLTHSSSSMKAMTSGEGDFQDSVVIYKNGQVRSPFVESFAAKLEADLRKLECDRQRAEGEVLRSPEERWVVGDATSGTEYLCTEGRGETNVFEDATPDTECHYDNVDGERRLEDEVWKPSELKDVFECYNKAAFYSYGAAMPVNEKFTTKTRGEKYEEIFPVPFHNNNTIKVYRPASESESPLSQEEENLSGVERRLTVTDAQLEEFIDSCIFADNVDKVVVPRAGVTNTNIVCDDSIEYGGRSFNRLLIYDLVKSIMSECTERYSHSVSVCVDFPFHLVQSGVLRVLQEDRSSSQPTPSGLQVFRNSTLLSALENELQQNHLLSQRLVQEMAASEVRSQDKRWQNFIREELEIKEAISTELLDDLISETTDLCSSVLRRKFM